MASGQMLDHACAFTNNRAMALATSRPIVELREGRNGTVVYNGSNPVNLQAYVLSGSGKPKPCPLVFNFAKALNKYERKHSDYSIGHT